MSSCRTPPFVPPHYHHHQDDPKRHRNISFPITMIQCSSLCCFSLLTNITMVFPKIIRCWCLSEELVLPLVLVGACRKTPPKDDSIVGSTHSRVNTTDIVIILITNVIIITITSPSCDHHHIIIAIVIIILTMRMNMPSLLSCHHCIVLLSSRTLRLLLNPNSSFCLT